MSPPCNTFTGNGYTWRYLVSARCCSACLYSYIDVHSYNSDTTTYGGEGQVAVKCNWPWAGRPFILRKMCSLRANWTPAGVHNVLSINHMAPSYEKCLMMPPLAQFPKKGRYDKRPQWLYRLHRTPRLIRSGICCRKHSLKRATLIGSIT